MSDNGSGSVNPAAPLPFGETPHEVFEAADASSSPPSTTSTSCGSDQDLHRTWPTSVDVIDIPAMATWGICEMPSSDKLLDSLYFDIHWNIKSQSAFFTLHTSLTPQKRKRAERSRVRKAPFYIQIHPERIRELSLDAKPSTKPLGSGSMLLSFVMDKPPALVMPTAIDDSSKDLMDACHRLASQTTFQLYLDCPRSMMTEARLQELCSAACGAGLSTLDRWAATDDLYSGEGGRVVEGDTLIGSALCGTDPPPDYNAPAPRPTAGPGDIKGKKRRRLDSPSPEPLTTDHATRAILLMLDSIRTELRQDFAALKKEVTEAMAAHQKEVAEKLQKTEARIESTIRSEFGDHWNKMEETMLDRVSEDIATAEENIMQNLTEQELTATLTFTHHPVY